MLLRYLLLVGEVVGDCDLEQEMGLMRGGSRATAHDGNYLDDLISRPTAAV